MNVEGGAIAHGHPIGAAGAVLATRLLHSMQRDKLKRGLVTLCIGGGQGIATLTINLHQGSRTYVPLGALKNAGIHGFPARPCWTTLPP